MYSIILHKATRPSSIVAKGLSYKDATDRAETIYDKYKILAGLDFAVSGLSVLIVKDQDAPDVCSGFKLNDPRIVLQYGCY